jgi:hypothetical protein
MKVKGCSCRMHCNGRQTVLQWQMGCCKMQVDASYNVNW